MTYVHHIPGRLRIRTEGARRDPAQKALKEWLESLEGVKRVDVSPLTGSVLIRYSAGAIDGNRLVALMRDQGWIVGAIARRKAAVQPRPAPKRSRAGVQRALAKVVVRHLAEIAIERSLLALVAAVL